MSESVISPLSDFEMKEYVPLIFESAVEAFSLAPPYEIIHSINLEFYAEYQNLIGELTDPFGITTVLEQIEEGKLDSVLQKFYHTLYANFAVHQIPFESFKQLILKETLELSRLDKETIQEKISVFQTIIKLHFGNVKKILLDAAFEANDEKMQILFPQLLEGYERVLMALDQRHKENSMVEKVLALAQVVFIYTEEDLLAFCEKNQSLLEGKYLVEKLENIAILTRLFSEGTNIDVGIFIKEVLVNWRNEFTDLIRQAKEEKRILKEDAKKKKIKVTEETIDLLYSEIAPRFLENKNLKAILMEIKGNFKTTEDKVLLSELLKQLTTIEQPFIKLLQKEEINAHYKNFNKNEFEENPLMYFAVLYKSLADNQIDFLADVLKKTDEHYQLRLGARKLLFTRMIQNTKIKNPVGENRIIGLFLSSFERFILNDDEPIAIRRDNIVRLTKMIIMGNIDLGENFDTLLSDIFIKVFTEVLDVNLVNKYANLKKLSAKEAEAIELVKNAFKLYEIVSKELHNIDNKTREQARRNDILINKIERKLLNSIKKIRNHATILS